jgi:Coenzyme PQQ synthesis protein D (PqqD)
VESSVAAAPSHDVTVSDLDGRVVVFNPKTGRVASLNETASDIWRLLDGRRDVDQIAVELAQRYGVAIQDIRADVAATLEQLGAEGLIDPRPSAPEDAASRRQL